MVAHLFPSSLCIVMSVRSSSAVHSPFTIWGSKWWHQRSRHCFDVLPGMRAARAPQFLWPSSTSLMRSSSSSFDHWPFTRPGLWCVLNVDVLIQFRGEGASDNPNPSDSDGGQNTVWLNYPQKCYVCNWEELEEHLPCSWLLSSNSMAVANAGKLV